MILSIARKFIFFACGKTGTTSIERVLKPYHDGDELLAPMNEVIRAEGRNPKHVRPARVKEYLPAEVWNDCFKFVFVRNPWDWVVSQYYFSNFKKSRLDLFSDRIRSRDVSKVWNRMAAIRGADPDDSHMQYVYAFTPEGVPLVDFVGRFERLQEDFDRICDRLEIPRAELPVQNTTSHKPYGKLYTRRAKALAGRLYEKDVRLLGYGFDAVPPPEAV
jgi:hypothetical protein